MNRKGSPIFEKHSGNITPAANEIEKLLESTTEDGGDEVVQFQADQFIADHFCMGIPKKKRIKEPIRGLAEAVALQERMGFQVCFESPKLDDTRIKESCRTIEDTNRRMLDILRNTNDKSNEEIKIQELDSLLREGYEAYDRGYFSLAAVKYKSAWEMITEATANNKLRIEHVNEIVVCYMLCLTLLESDQTNHLSEAVELLIALEKCSSHIFPTVYYALSKAHYKHYRFSLALKAIEKGFAFLDSDIALTEYTIPGSNVILKESTRDGLSVSLAAMKDECSKWHPPDAVCCMGNECLPGSKWYGPNRNIYFRDPAFNGMVVLTCSNERNPCSIKYHQACWKLKKDQLSALKKLSDKDIIGHECFTPNCDRGSIIKIAIYGEDGKLKTHIEPPANKTVWTKQRPQPKGAIPKQPPKPKRQSEKMRKPGIAATPRSACKELVAEDNCEKIAWRLLKLAELRRNNFGIKPNHEWRPDMVMYGNPQMSEIGDFLGGSIFEKDSSKISAVDTFLFTYFYEFIKENGCVRKRDVNRKLEEIKFILDNQSDELHKDTDICEFLLQSYKLISIGDYIVIAENMPELYAKIRSEVCDCLRFLLTNPLRLLAATAQDDVFNLIISDCDENENKSLTAIVGSDEEPNTGMTNDNISDGVAVIPSDVLEHEAANGRANLLIDTIPKNSPNLSLDSDTDDRPPLRNEESLTARNLSPSTESESIDGPADTAQLVAPWEAPNDTPATPDQFSNEIYLELSTEPKISEAGPEVGLQDEEPPPELIEFGAYFKEGASSGSCNHLEELESIPPLRKPSDEDSDIGEPNVKNFELSYSLKNRVIHETPQLPPVDSLIEEEPSVESSKNDPEATARAIIELNTAFERYIVESEAREQLLQEQLRVSKMVSKEKIFELMNDFKRMETRCATLESEKSQITQQLETCERDLGKANEENVVLKLNNVELTCKYEKLREDKAEIENNFNVLLREKSALENNLKVLQREREESLEKLLKYKARLNERKDCTDDAEPTDRLRKERTSRLRSLNHEFAMNEYAFKMACEKCNDHTRMLDDMGRLLAFLTGRQIVEIDLARSAWQGTSCRLYRMAADHKEVYLKLKASLESDEPIENLGDIGLPPPKIEFPPASTLADLYHKARADFSTNRMWNPWAVQQQALCTDPSYYVPPARISVPDRRKPNFGMNAAYCTWYESVPRHESNPRIQTDPMRESQNRFLRPDENCGSTDGRWNRKDGNIATGFDEAPENAGQLAASNVVDAEMGGIKKEYFEGKIEQDETLMFYRTKKNERTTSDPAETSSANELEDTSRISVDRSPTPLKKIGTDLLISQLKRRFVGIPELDLLESVRDLRKSRNDTLSGMRVENIVHEIEPFIKRRQKKHMAQYSGSTTSLERPVAPSSGHSQRKLSPTQPSSKNGQHPGKKSAPTQRRVNKLVNRDRPTGTPVPPAPSAVKKPAWAPVTSGLVDWNKNEEDTECTICFEDMEKAPVHMLPCQHSFHTACIKKWLAESSICPNCRIHCMMDDEYPPLPS